MPSSADQALGQGARRTCIPRDHPVAQAILADYPGAWLVWATVIGDRRLMLDYAYPDAGAPAFTAFSAVASAVVEGSWTPQDPGPWRKCDDFEPVWSIEIASQ